MTVVERIEAAVEELDVTIKHIRSAIFGLSTITDGRRGVRDAVLALLGDAASVARIHTPGAFRRSDRHHDPRRGGHRPGGTIGEALTNVARHAGASHVDIAVTVNDLVTLTATDDGVGLPASETTRGRGVGNLAARAAHHGGTMLLATGPSGGTILTWQVPPEPRGAAPSTT